MKNVSNLIEKVKQIHGDKYEYIKINDQGWRKCKSIIGCSVHGNVSLWLERHINDIPLCPLCKKDRNNIKKQDNFIKKAQEIHQYKYNYSKVKYTGNHNKICIICPEHGEFWQTPANHIHKTNPCGCPQCANNFKLTNEIFIEKARKVHGNKYDYSKVNYIDTKTKICIVCPEHGEFWQTPNSHLCGRGCEKCGRLKLKYNFMYDKNVFLNKAREVHGDKYDYSKVEYKGMKEKVCIICPEHGEFWQLADGHLRGNGCKKCIKNIGEETIQKVLEKYHIKYERFYHTEWLGKLELDFYLPDYNIAIEYQGEQHYHPVKYFGGEKRFNDRLKRDKRKFSLCAENGIKLLYVSFYKDCDDSAIKNIDMLIEEIFNNKSR